MYVIGVFDDPKKDLKHIKIERDSFQDIMSKLQIEEDFKYEIFEGNSLESLMDKIDELQEVLGWFHFSGHHDKGGIELNDGNFSSLVDHLKNCKNLKGVFINGCASDSTLEKLKGIVPICIGTNKPVNDGLATKFSQKFYQKMTDIKNWNDYVKIHKAFELTKSQVKDLLNGKEGIDGIDFNVRGGGSLKDLELEDNFYLISEDNENCKKLFNRLDNYIFNQHLTKELIESLPDMESHASFLNSLFDRDEWELDPKNLKEAQTILVDTYVAVIGKELRRLFVIGDEKEDLENKNKSFIEHCLITYRISLQLIVYVFISVLWDEKKENMEIVTKEKLIWNFFRSNKKLTLNELHSLFQLLIGIFESNKLDFPIEKEDLGDLDEFLKEGSQFNKAIDHLEDLEEKSIAQNDCGLQECQIAEESLATIISAFKFLSSYQLITIKKIEYEQTRYSGARYIKEIKLLDYIESEDTNRILEFDQEAEPSYTVKFTNGTKQIYLFPFLLDFNALISADKPHLYFYESINGENGINYRSIEDGEEKTIFYEAAEVNQYEEIEDELNKDKLQKKIRLDQVTKHFEKASNRFLGTDFEFKSKENNTISKLKALKKN